MDRKIVYPGQIPLSAQFLQSEQNKMSALAFACQCILGTNVVIDGLSCTPTFPTSLSVQIGAGSLYHIANLESSSFGSLPSDITHSIVKQAINFDVSSFTLTPPGTIGQSIVYLIQAGLSETDADPIVLPYVNSADPSQPFTGPSGSGNSQNTTRKVRVALSAKSGVAATSGTEEPPAVDPGYTALYWITVPQGATTLDASNIVRADNAPFLDVKLPDLPKWVQAGEYSWGVDTGTANAISVVLTPGPDAYVPPMPMFIKKMNAANTGPMTITVKRPDGVSLGTVALTDAAGSPFADGDVPAGFVMAIIYDGTACRVVNGTIQIAPISVLTAASGEGIDVKVDNTVNLNFPSLPVGTPTALDIFAFHDNEGPGHKGISWANLLAAIGVAGIAGGGLLNVQFFEASGTYTKTPGAKRALVFVTGGGGGGGGNINGNTASSGGAGATAIDFVDLAAVTTVPVTIGDGGLRGAAGGGAGTNGGTSSFGTFAVAGGGKSGYGTSGWHSRSGLGGVATAGLVKLNGSPGGGPSNVNGGDGGNSFWGGGGVHGCDTATTPTYPAGGDATGYGSGGGGGDGPPSQGGLGRSGCVLVLEFS